MKMLHEYIEKEDPKALWECLALSRSDFTRERVDAFIKVYSKVTEEKPEHGGYVLRGIRRRQEGEEDICSFQVMTRSMDLSVWIPVEWRTLGRLLGMYIPEELSSVCHTTVICELFRVLVEQETRKKKYRLKKVRRELTAGLAEDRRGFLYLRNTMARTDGLKKYTDQKLVTKILAECREVFPEMGKPLSWETLLDGLELTEEFCRSLFPPNPPTLSRMQDVLRCVRGEIEWEKQENIHFRMRSLFFAQLKEKCGSRIIVDKNHMAGVNVPIVYIIEEDGTRREVRPDDMNEIGEHCVIVRDTRLLKDHNALAGFIFLYFAYPRRMHREMKKLQLQELAYLLAHRP